MTNFHTVDNKELSLKKSFTHPESFHSLFFYFASKLKHQASWTLQTNKKTWDLAFIKCNFLWQVQKWILQMQSRKLVWLSIHQMRYKFLLKHQNVMLLIWFSSKIILRQTWQTSWKNTRFVIMDDFNLS